VTVDHSRREGHNAPQRVSVECCGIADRHRLVGPPARSWSVRTRTACDTLSPRSVTRTSRVVQVTLQRLRAELRLSGCLMNDKPVFDASMVLLPSAAERRAAVRLAAEKRDEERRQQFELLTSPIRTAGERIALWERLYEIPLPEGAEHPLVRVILAHTGLTADDIHEEQRRRREASIRPSGGR
jgi:hypothetical protein